MEMAVKCVPDIINDKRVARTPRSASIALLHEADVMLLLLLAGQDRCDNGMRPSMTVIAGEGTKQSPFECRIFIQGEVEAEKDS